MQEKLKKVIIYTDGSCSGNPGKGGWGAVLIYGNHVKEISGKNKETTNNQMELKAVIEALKVLKQSCEIDLYTDSHYVKNGITKWIHDWKVKEWRTANRKQVKNVELWKELDEEVERHKIKWHWVKGHSGDKWNERADELARSS
ncbi:ribonuclease HI [Pseudomonadota bacterium]